jgi:hypothetical protein
VTEVLRIVRGVAQEWCFEPQKKGSEAARSSGAAPHTQGAVTRLMSVPDASSACGLVEQTAKGFRKKPATSSRLARECRLGSVH